MSSSRTGWSCWSLTITGSVLPLDLEVEQRRAVDQHLAQHARVDLERHGVVAGRCRRRRTPGTRPSRRRRRVARVPRSGRSSTVECGSLSVGHTAGQCSDGRRARARPMPRSRWRGTTTARSRRAGSGARRRSARWSARRAPATPARGRPTSRARRTRRADALERRHLEAAERMVDTLGRMKGAAMKIGQLASFIDTEFLPPEYRELYQEQLAQLRTAGADDALEARCARCSTRSGRSPARSCSRTSSTRPPRRPRSARCTAPCCPTAAGWRSRSSTPAWPRRSRADMQNAGLILRMAKALAPGLDAKAAAEELKERVMEELDYELEAQNQRSFARGYRGHPFIHVPDVVTRLSTDARAGERVGRRRRLRGGQAAAAGRARPLRRDRLPLLLRLDLPPAALQRRRPPRQLPADARRQGRRSSTSA